MKHNTDLVTGRRLLLAAAYGLTSSLLGTTAQAGKCESGKGGNYTAGDEQQGCSTLHR